MSCSRTQHNGAGEARTCNPSVSSLPLSSITACDYPHMNTKEHTVNVLKFQTLFSFFSQIKCWVIKTGNHKMLVRIANRKDLDQTASSIGESSKFPKS